MHIWVITLNYNREIVIQKEGNGQECFGSLNETEACNTDPCVKCLDSNFVTYEIYDTVNDTDCEIWLVGGSPVVIFIKYVYTSYKNKCKISFLYKIYW